MPTRLEQLQTLLAADPDDADLLYMIAMEHTKAAAFADAIDWFDRTLEKNPSYLYAYFQKAKALAQLGQDDEAKQVLVVGIEKATQAGDAKAVSELTELMASL